MKVGKKTKVHGERDFKDNRNFGEKTKKQNKKKSIGDGRKIKTRGVKGRDE